MSESDVEPGEDNPLLKALIEFTGCIGGAFDDVCSYALIPGDGYIPFTPDEEDEENCEDEDCSQVWVRVTSINAIGENGWDTSCAMTLSVGLEVGIIRCMEVVANGEAPSATALLGYSMQAMDDMRAIMCAAINCEIAGNLDLGVWTPLGPMGGEFGGQWTMTAEFA